MINPFQPGDTKVYLHTVAEDDTARFPTGEVHAVYSTFAIARDAEWAGRLFVLEMKESDEEGIGTAVTISHKSPALIGEIVTITSTLQEVSGNEIITPFEARAGVRLIASGETRQKILKKEKLDRLFAALKG
jgi:fluoroacetyl-CoA thioesterase